MQHEVLFKVVVSYIFFQEWYDREERETHLSRDTSSMAENKTKIYRTNSRISGLISRFILLLSNFLSSGYDKLSNVSVQKVTIRSKSNIFHKGLKSSKLQYNMSFNSKLVYLFYGIIKRIYLVIPLPWPKIKQRHTE